MGKKYIVEIGRLERLYKAFIGAHGKPEITWLSPEVDLTPYTVSGFEQVRKEAYEKGLSDAWEAVRKIYSFDLEEREELFHDSKGLNIGSICEAYSASEAIEKIRQYEQEKEEIKIGDEVELKCGVSPAIYMQGTDGSDEIYLLFNDGSCGVHNRREIECKTGRHFPEIAELLQKMKETNNG